MCSSYTIGCTSQFQDGGLIGICPQLLLPYRYVQGIISLCSFLDSGREACSSRETLFELTSTSKPATSIVCWSATGRPRRHLSHCNKSAVPNCPRSSSPEYTLAAPYHDVVSLCATSPLHYHHSLADIPIGRVRRTLRTFLCA